MCPSSMQHASTPSYAKKKHRRSLGQLAPHARIEKAIAMTRNDLESTAFSMKV
jgi:hypothetical protein